MFRRAEVQAFDPRLPPALYRRTSPVKGVLIWRGHSVGWTVPLLALAAAVLLELGTGPETRLLYWFVLVPWLSVRLCGLWGTLVFVVLSVVCAGVLYSMGLKPYANHPPVYALLVVSGLMALAIAWILIRRDESLLRVRDIAETTRRTVLRPLPSGLGGLDHCAIYLPAVHEALIGGDFYDIQPSPWGVRVLIGDVQGKGLDAVEVASVLLGTFREAGYHEESLQTIASRMEVRLCRQTAESAAMGVEENRDRFATAVILAFPADEPQILEMVNLGHDPPLLVGPDGTVRALPGEHGLPLGMSEIATLPAPLVRTRIAPGTTVLLTTDGVTEVRDRSGAFYPLRAEVERAVAADPGLSDPGALAGMVRRSVLRHGRGRLTDDTTILTVRRRPSGEQKEGGTARPGCTREPDTGRTEPG
ncbi:PP2C family protein-serine/threonine phosphatase [Streptomyces sp. NPDC048106]|uniref:PP2C family protein-serine/threonine phosphatase n=1 Tax=Streptomyces sp. NPDC048106 TaxID=3155750 RepID=UPI003455A826